jgi:hypothetical protein
MPEELIPIFLFASIAAVAIFRPLTKRIGLVIERAYEERRFNAEPQLQRLTQLVERLVDRMDSLEDRLDFTERVLERERAAAALTREPVDAQPGVRPDDRSGGRRDSLSAL